MSDIGTPFDPNNLPYRFRGLAISERECVHLTVGSKSSVLKKLLPDIGEDQRYDLLDDDEFEGLCERLDGAWLLTIGEITKLTIGSVGFAANELKREDDRTGPKWPEQFNLIWNKIRPFHLRLRIHLLGLRKLCREQNCDTSTGRSDC